jgi:hypothetical protein
MVKRKRVGGLPHSYGWLRRPECEPDSLTHVYETPDGILVSVPSHLPECQIVSQATHLLNSVVRKEHE